MSAKRGPVLAFNLPGGATRLLASQSVTPMGIQKNKTQNVEKLKYKIVFKYNPRIFEKHFRVCAFIIGVILYIYYCILQ